MKINGKIVKGDCFVWDGCHKIYIIEDDEDFKQSQEYGYDKVFYDINEIRMIWEQSCSLRFISNWKLTTRYVKQFEDLVIER